MSLFYDVAAALAEPDVGRALERTLRLVAQQLHLDAAWVWLLDEADGRFYLAAAYDLPPYLREPPHMTGEPCWCMQAFLDGDFVSRNVDVISCSRLQAGIDEAGEGATRGLRSHASVLLRFGDRALGLLNAARAEHPALGAAELETLATVGAQAGVAVERARLAERATAAARVEERVALARELHDTILQDLTAIALHLESAERKVPADPQVAQKRITTAIDLARRALGEVRRNVEGLRGDPLAGEPLATALARLARRFTSETGIPVAVRGAPAPRLAAPAELAAYRIVSEALANVRRHAGARHVELAFDDDGETFKIALRDDGAGFDSNATAAGFGIVGMRERARELGGTLAVRSAPNAGTLVEASLPLENR